MIPIGAISADSHVVEPPNCYVDNIEPRYRDDAPRVVEQEDGSDAFFNQGNEKARWPRAHGWGWLHASRTQ